MDDLRQRFEEAAARSKSLDRRPDNDELLLLYALYKQATVGDVSGKRPGMTDFVGRAKYDAWAEKRGTPEVEAMQAYVALVERLEGAG